MIATHRALLFFLLISLCVMQQVLSAQPKLDSKEKKHYKASLALLRSRHGFGRQYRPTEYLAHLLPAHPTLEDEAWHFAQQPGNGPISWTLDRSERNIFATTKVPTQSRLGSAWNLNWRDSPMDAYAFWRIDKSGHKLLRLDTWPAGAPTAESTTLEWILRRIACSTVDELALRPGWRCF